MRFPFRQKLRLSSTIDAAAVFAGACFVIAIFFGTIWDDEDAQVPLLSTVFHARQVFEHGTYPFWNPYLGFGMPHPFSHSFSFHPLVPLFYLLPLESAVRVFYLFHSILGAVSIWFLAKHFRVSRALRPVAVVTFLFSSAAVQFTFVDLFPVLHLSFMTLPWLLLAFFKLLTTEDRAGRWGWTLLLGVSGGMYLHGSHPGIYFAYLTPLAPLICFAWWNNRKRTPEVFVSGLIALVVGAPYLFHLVRELSQFPGPIRETPPLPLGTLEMLWASLLRPLSLSWSPIEWIKRSSSGIGGRTVYLGPIAAAISIYFVLTQLRSRRFSAQEKMLAAAIVIGVIGVSVPARSYYPLNFREPLTIAAILLSLRFLTLVRSEIWAGILALLQIVLVVMGTSGFLYLNLEKAVTQPNPLVQIASGDESFRELETLLRKDPGRIAMTDDFLTRVIGREIPLRVPGVYINFGAYHELPLLPGRFKGISHHSFFPDKGNPYAEIGTTGNWFLREHNPEFFGLKYVLASEKDSMRAPWTELARKQIMVGHEKESFSVWKNLQVTFPASRFTIGNLIDAEVISDCPDTRIRCRDFGELARRALPDPVVLTRPDVNRISLQFPARQEPSEILIFEKYDAYWKVEGAKEAQITPYLGAFLRVSVPARATGLSLQYHPTLRWILTCLSALAMVSGLALALGCYFVRLWNRRKASTVPIIAATVSAHTSV